MNDFIFHNPDKVYFGKDQLKHLPHEILKLGRKGMEAFVEKWGIAPPLVNVFCII